MTRYTVVLEGKGHCGSVQRSYERAEQVNAQYFKGKGKIVEVEGRRDLDKIEGGVVAPKIKGKPGRPKSSASAVQSQSEPMQQSIRSMFSVEQRFDMMDTITSMVARSAHKSMFVAGNGGTGKTMTVLRSLDESGMRCVDMSGLDPENEMAIQDNRAYIRVMGATSPVGLYRLLYENNDKLIVFDDCDGFLKNENAINILKTVLDTTGDNVVSWRSPFIDSKGLPESFQFRGRVVFISNKTIDQLPQAIASRALIVDMTLNNQEIIERARMLGEDLVPRLSASQREELITFVEQNQDKLKDVSLRTFVLAEPYVAENLPNWRELVLFTA